MSVVASESLGLLHVCSQMRHGPTSNSSVTDLRQRLLSRYLSRRLLYAYCHMWHRIDLLLITWSIINRLCLWHLRLENATTVQHTLLLFIRFRPILYYTIVNQLHDKSPSHTHMNKCNGNRAISPHKPLTDGYWWCVFLRPICRCRQGYRGPGTSCVEINRCLEPDRGGCHQQV